MTIRKLSLHCAVVLLATGVAACESSTGPTVSLPLQWFGKAKLTAHAVGNIGGTRGEGTLTFEADVVWDEDPLLAPPVSDARSYKIRSGLMKWTLAVTAEDEEGQCTTRAEFFDSLSRKDGYLLVNEQGAYSGWIKPRREITATTTGPCSPRGGVTTVMELGLDIDGQADVKNVDGHLQDTKEVPVTISGMAGTGTRTWDFAPGARRIEFP